MIVDLIVLAKILALVILIQRFFKTSIGQKIGNYLPTPFWIYFIPILLSTAGFLPHESQAYEDVAKHVLPAALILMLIGTPVSLLLKLGPKATQAMIVGSATMVVATIVMFAAMVKFLPVDSFKAAGALLATWTGGSANMLAVKELVSLSDATFAPLVIVDTILSYAWMAALILGVSYQRRFDAGFGSESGFVKPLVEAPGFVSGSNSLFQSKIFRIAANLAFAFLLAEGMILIGGMVGRHFTLLSGRGWAILFSSTAAIFLAMTPLRQLESWGSTRVGSFLLYVVLATIGSKTDLSAARQAPVFLIYGAGVLLIHGILVLSLGRYFKIPLFLLSTASQANVGGPISAPIVAEIYQPGTAQVGVIMGVIGNVVGTYIGLFGCWICHLLETSLR